MVAGRALHASDGRRRGRPRGRARDAQRREILRANGTRFAPRAIRGPRRNYLTYFHPRAARWLDIGRPDIVVSLTDPPIIGLAARWAARRAGARFVFLCEDIFPEVAALLEDFHNALVNRTLDRVNRYLLRDADAVVALGDRMRRRLVEEKGADPARISIIHNWADCEAIVPRPKDNAFAREHGLDDRFVADALRQHRHVAEPRRARRRRPTAAPQGPAGDRDRRRRLAAEPRSRPTSRAAA